MTRFEILVSGLAAAVAGLLYLVRQLRGVAKMIAFIAGLPEEQRQLREATAANTKAIQLLTAQLASERRVERTRRIR
jgi:hypothetical protein